MDDNNLGITIVNEDCDNCDNCCNCNKLKCYVSITMYSIISVDTQNRTAKMKVVIDFKYKVREYLKHFNKTKKYDDIKIPWTVANLVDYEQITENNFLKKTSLEPFELNNKINSSVYGGYSSITDDTSINLSSISNNFTTIGDDLIKCESKTIIVDVSYYTEERHAPFDTIHIFFKLCTTGQPGTENIVFVYDSPDSNFQGYNVIGSGYYPIFKKPKISSITIKYDKLNIQYSRLYFILSYQHNWIADVVKYYIIPTILMLLLVIVEIKDKQQQISIASTLVLADIALLFTIPTRSYISFMEYSIIINILFMLTSTYLLLEFHTKQHRLSLGLTSVCLGTFTFLYHYGRSYISKKKILKGINNKDYSDLNTK